MSNKVAGSGYGFSGDGAAATSAQLYFPTGVALDGAGNLFIADTGNHRIRQVSTSGIITTIAGTGTAAFSGDGGLAISAQLNSPGGLALDHAGSLYFADQLNHAIRRIAPDGLISKVAGIGQPSISLDGYEAEVTHLNSPAGVAVDGAGNLFIADTGNNRVLVVVAYRSFANVSAASYIGATVASEMIAAAFGTGLATTTEVAIALPLPTVLAETAVNVRDSAGQEKAAPLFFVSPAQVNYQIPPGMMGGPATVIISTGAVFISPTAPGLFAANADGQGVPAAVVLRVKANGEQSYEPVATFNAAQNRYIAQPIDFGPSGDQVYLLLFGTGLRGHSSLAAVNATIGGINADVLFAGAQGGFAGLDQINVRLPRNLAGRGEVDIILTVEGKVANVVRVNIK